ncbi:cob(I)yrinic acid a,c-diamide adenosyltransferase [Celerinatantimonas yamalensis]|uniref:Corrinoid adenosyltransferase n=1 Tax=Celerinatantimonas yamalensis TaxID=559956 RepID=A0ABW9G701_9GAMM
MSDTDRYQQRQQKLKSQIDERIASAQHERGLVLVITGNGKGKSTSGFGTVARAVGHGQQAGVVQFIKGTWACGERNLLAQHGVQFAVMATGFTWDTQNKEHDRRAAQAVWQQGKAMLANPNLDVVLLDELTYMVSYDYIDLDEVIEVIEHRPIDMSVIITGRGAHRRLMALADTVSEVQSRKHAFDHGLKARQGIDW